jgi:hypothetical protein
MVADNVACSLCSTTYHYREIVLICVLMNKWLLIMLACSLCSTTYHYREIVLSVC